LSYAFLLLSILPGKIIGL